ncbi:hypothetical protein C7212DRAFT_363894 [Tuber magnatum]|uniref:Uncharacterized protein n=1 Tax=Tuber magnatum TaxID=42249 RepID=A0A317SNP1_9PEZI|nr:hypothetical protein C7212DRAFT_363894 [Tuber magnatum]
MAIKRKTVRKQRRYDLLALLEVWNVLAQEEDIFDKIIAKETGVREEGGTWDHGVRSTWRDVKDLLRKEELRGSEMTKRFIEIIEQKKKTREDMILERDRAKRRKKWNKYLLKRAERKKQEKEEAELLVEREAALEGSGMITAGEWDEASGVPFAHQSGYEEPEHGDPEHEYEEYGHDDSDQECEEYEHDYSDQEHQEHGYNDPEHEHQGSDHSDPEHEYRESELSSNSNLDNTNPNPHPTPVLTPDSSIPPVSEPTSTPEDKP